ncbi:hypothetical protein J1N35_011128 [Gossypium stocksii]|uniref:Alpha-1,3-glucosyltransferase n=1 Tax=Gossypium stocksii TaxID=47602 RepID=A0A9D3W3G3_9ROSI|nr:hypothetical protein J1N35_011128 [Gossypium stocksii]
MSLILVFCFALVYCSMRFGIGQNSDVAWHIAMILLNLCLILIDHGHFQYNCISLGLTIAAIAAALSQKDLVASCYIVLLLTINRWGNTPLYEARMCGNKNLIKLLEDVKSTQL